MTPPKMPTPPASPSPAQWPPQMAARSPVWQWFLGGSATAASALLLELGKDLVSQQISNDPTAKLVIGSLGWLLDIGLLAAVGYTLLRIIGEARDRLRTGNAGAADAPIDDIGQTYAITVDSGPADGDYLDTVLAHLPVAEIDVDMLLAVITAVVDNRWAIPGEPAEPRKPFDVVARYQQDGLLVPVADGGGRAFRAIHHDKYDTVALITVLHQHAERAGRWAAALNSPPHAHAARQRLEAEAGNLHDLVDHCLSELEPLDRDKIDPAVITEIAGICDALDVWRAVQNLPPDREQARKLAGVASRDRFPFEHGLASLRAGIVRNVPTRPGYRTRHVRDRLRGSVPATPTPDDLRHYRPRRSAGSLYARWSHSRALDELKQDPAESERLLEDAWWMLAHRDVVGEVCTLADLAVVHLRQGRLDAALDRLDLAEALTKPLVPPEPNSSPDTSPGPDPGGRAYVREIYGVVWWAKGSPVRAIRCWQLAQHGYTQLGDIVAAARCESHLTQARDAVPELNTSRREPDPPTTRRRSGWLRTLLG